MINIFLGICGTLFIISAALLLIGLKIKLPLMYKITKPMPLVFLLAAAVLVLVRLLPDSRNIIICLSASFVFAETALILFMTEKKLAFIYGHIFFMLSNLCVLCLYAPSFRLLPLPLYASVPAILAYGALMFIQYRKYISSQSNRDTILWLFSSVVIAALNLSGIVTMICDFDIYSIVFFAGTLCLMLISFIYCRWFCSEDKKNQQFWIMLLVIIFQLLIYTGSVLMVYRN